MPRTHGYAPVGERVHGVKDWHARGRTNVIGALIGKTLLTINLFIANITADIFYAWITQDLLTKLLPACVIVMDNATFHKRQDIQTAIANAGHTLEYLPPYSPDLNDIEPKWAQAKAIRKKEGCSIEQLFAAYEIKSFYMGSAIFSFQIKNDMRAGRRQDPSYGKVRPTKSVLM